MTYRLFTLAILLAISSVFASADDRFALTLGAQGNLIIFGPKGERTEITVPTISKSITVGATTFQISFGRDANDLLTAILAPDSTQPQDLHFDVAGKKVDADKQAVVTLTFRGNRVNIDPGYIGAVTVNSEPVRHHALADSSPAPVPQQTSAPSIAPRSSVAPQPRPVAPAPVVVSTPKPAPVQHQPVASVQHESKSAPVAAADPAPAADKSDPAPVNGYTPVVVAPNPPFLGSLAAQPPMGFGAPSGSGGGAPPPDGKLYWSEPITPPSGVAPTVSLDQMKLVEVQGDVSIKLADGDIKTAHDGMILPSGSTVSTAPNASAAVFMGGVNSIRLLPDTEAKVSQKLTGSTRHTKVNLQQGAVFSRVGHRDGEAQDYEVSTPEGVAAARGTEFADYRGKGSDGKIHHYVFVAKGIVQTFVAGETFKVVAGSGSDLGSASMPPADDAAAIIRALLVTLQPYNLKLAGVLVRVQNGTASPGDTAFYNAVVSYFTIDLQNIVNEYKDTVNPLYNIVPAARRALNQILEPFGTVPLTPF